MSPSTSPPPISSVTIGAWRSRQDPARLDDRSAEEEEASRGGARGSVPHQRLDDPDGLAVSASIGRFGPYVRYGDKYVSTKEDDPYTIELPRALELIELKKIEDANRIILDFEEQGIQVLNGRYGPYITDKAKNARVPKDREPKSLTLEECIELLAAAPQRGRRSKKKVAKKKAATKKKTAKKKARKKAKKKKKKTAAKKTADTKSD